MSTQLVVEAIIHNQALGELASSFKLLARYMPIPCLYQY